jgi:uncharacterized protein
MTTYLDSSAIVKLVAREPETDALREYLRTRPWRATSIVGAIEVMRAGRRRAPGAADAIAAALEGIAVLPLDGEIASRAGRLDPPGMRTLDAIHLASAMELSPDLDVVVTYDGRLAEAAEGCGLTVASPGTAIG